MNTSSKKRNSIIAIIISIALMVGVIFAAIFVPNLKSASADTYNYGVYNEAGYYSLNGVTFYGVKIKSVSSTANPDDYWPNYTVVEENEKPVTVKFGETILLKEDEAILLCFARQTDDGSGLVKDPSENIISTSIDYLNATVSVNGQNYSNALENTLPGESESFKKELGYIIDPNGCVTSAGKLGVNGGNEGLVNFSTTQYEVNGTLQQFSFMFYAFKESTYRRTETQYTATSFIRPDTAILNTTSQVTDEETKADYYAEYFYNYSSNNLPYLTIDLARYEVLIEKTIHRSSSTYSFALDKNATNSSQTVLNNKIVTSTTTIGDDVVVQTITKALSTMDIYARELRVEHISGTKVKIYFEDLGQYTITYSAVYYDNKNETTEKVSLNNLNIDSRADILTIFGTEATYQDGNIGQTPFRNKTNTVYADLTGHLANIDDVITTSHKLSLPLGVTIASTNQPPIKFMFNSTVGAFNVYYSSTLDGDFEIQTGYAYTSSFDNPGYYVVSIKNSFEGYKTWVSASTSSRTETLNTTQIYVFQIKQQTSNLELYILDDNGNIVPEADRERVYSNNYVKNGIQIIEFEKANEFDSQIYFEITKQEYNSSSSQTIILPNESYNELSAEQISWLASYGFTKYNGYYILKPTTNVEVDGIYTLALRFGKSGKEKISFKLDTKDIDGITSYNVESFYGTYNTKLIGSYGEVGLTNSAFTLLWNEKVSGAKITSKYVRYALNPKTYSATATDYIVNSTWLAADYEIALSETNPETIYEKSESKSNIVSNSILSLNGLYIFKLEDEAGNVAFYSIIVDDSTSTVLQKPTNSAENYKKITGINNVSEATTIFFGTKKAIKFVINDTPLTSSTVFTSEYLKALFNNLSISDTSNVIGTDEVTSNIFATVNITNVYEKTVDGATTRLSDEILSQGYYNRGIVLDQNNKITDVTFIYQIFDKSNSSKNTPTTTYSVIFNTDSTGLVLFTDLTDVQNSNINHVNSKTADTYESREKYYKSTNKNVVYLSWTTLKPIDKLGAYVDVSNDGLTCYHYPLVYNAEKNTYEYSTIGTPVDLGLLSLTDDQLNGVTPVQIPVNVVNGLTLAGKYVLTRTYTAQNGDPINTLDLGNDFATVTLIFFVDRNEIITSTDVNEEQVGEYAYITTFDGGDNSNKEYFNELYRQVQGSSNYVIQTNQLPIGFYIPVSKYGTVYGVSEGIIGSVKQLSEIQGLSADSIKFIDSVKFSGLDINDSLKLGSTYSPFELSVVLISPEKALKDGNEVNVYYYYSYSSTSGYYLLSGYSYGELAPSEDPTPIANYRSYITYNPVENNSQYPTGNYILQIGCVENSSNGYDQTFDVIVNVVAPEPEYEMIAEYSELDNMETREIASQNGVYYTNANEIRISWTNSSNKYLTKIDISKISYTYKIGSANVTVDVAVEDIKQVGDTYNFVANFPKEASSLVINMTYEVYSTDENSNYVLYYLNRLYKSAKTIRVYRQAPTDSINVLVNGDETVNGILVSSLREESTDTRYSKTVTTGTFAYYTFIANKEFIINLSKNLETNSPTQTKTLYYRLFNNKYTEAAFKETGLGYDQSARGDNLFSEYFAVANGWTKVTSAISDETVFDGYYEVVEIDLAGNMTIYSIYIGSLRNFDLNFTSKKIGEENGTIRVEKTTDDGITSIDAKVILETTTNFANITVSPVEINSYDFLKLNYISFNESNSYSYFKLIIDGVVYYVTPSNLSNVGTEASPKLGYSSAYNSNGELVNFSSITLSERSSLHTIQFIDTVNTINSTASVYGVNAKVASSSARLTDNGGALIASDVKGIYDSKGNEVASNIALVITTPINPALTVDETSIRIYKIKSDGTYCSYSIENIENQILIYNAVLSTTQVSYYYIKAENDFSTSTFYVLYKDNFGNEYKDLVEYKASLFNRFEGEYDITSESQNKTQILTSGMVAVNISNVYSVDLSLFDEKGANLNVSGKFNEIDSMLLGGSYRQYQLNAPAGSSSSFVGGLYTFKIVLSYNIPTEILDEIEGIYSEISSGAIETILVTIYNQMPVIKAIDSTGQDITEAFFAKEINQSDAVTLSFVDGNELSNSIGYTSKVYLKNRNDETFTQITSPFVVSEAGVYDMYIQNFDLEGNALDYVITKDFVISDLDVMFYTVVKTNSNGEQEIVSPTGKAFEYSSGKYASYHYIVNTTQFDVITNGAHVTKSEPLATSKLNTYVYEIVSSSGTIYKATIAISVVEQTTDILASNPFIWYLGTTYTVPSESSYIRSTNKEIYLCKGDIYNQITLRWASYYGIAENDVTAYISTDDGRTWNKANSTTSNGASTLILSKSSSYLFKFEDRAGNIQLFSSPSGFPSETTKVNFIRSVILNANGSVVIDNAVYNDEVVITLPTNTTHFYSTTPIITVYKNNEAYSIKANEKGEYVFEENGSYKIYFSAKVENGTKELNEDVLTFSIINKNDSRWAFNYVNSNGYIVSSIKYNDIEISTGLKNHALMVANEINLSAFDVDALGNRWFNNGYYTVTVVNPNETAGSPSFEFSFWLNNATAPIEVSLEEGTTTTKTVDVNYNKTNLFETLGDCYVQVDNKVIEIINEENLGEAEPYTIKTVGTHFVQVYTSSGKLVYSYSVVITEPLNTITIILIVVSSIVVVAGVLVFVFLRKRMKVR